MINLHEEAEHCTNCLEWLHNCQAECCKVFRLYMGNHKIPSFGNLYFPIRLSLDLKAYYEIHGCKYVHSILIIPIKDFKIVKVGFYAFFYRQCDKLNALNQCEGYPSDRPEICKIFNPFTKKGERGVHITPNCIWSYRKA